MASVVELIPDWTLQGDPDSLAARPVSHAGTVAMMQPIPQSVLDANNGFDLPENMYLYYTAAKLREGNVFLN
jgi:hypothetical protein